MLRGLRLEPAQALRVQPCVCSQSCDGAHEKSHGVGRPGAPGEPRTPPPQREERTAEQGPQGPFATPQTKGVVSPPSAPRKRSRVAQTKPRGPGSRCCWYHARGAGAAAWLPRHSASPGAPGGKGPPTTPPGIGDEPPATGPQLGVPDGRQRGRRSSQTGLRTAPTQRLH